MTKFLIEVNCANKTTSSQNLVTLKSLIRIEQRQNIGIKISVVLKLLDLNTLDQNESIAVRKLDRNF